MNDAIETWKSKLLDTGNRNNLVNFKDRRAASIEVVSENIELFFDALVHGKEFNVFDTKEWVDKNRKSGEDSPKTMSKEEFSSKILPYVGKRELLLYSQYDIDSVRVIKKIDQKATASLEETGVNIAYGILQKVSPKIKTLLCVAMLKPCWTAQSTLISLKQSRIF